MKNNKKQNHSGLQVFFIRSVIVIAFLGLFSFFLYLPFLRDLFEDSLSINIYTFTDVIPYELFHEFEEKTGITVNVKNFVLNEELFAQFKISRGKGCDLATPSDYTVQLMIREGILQKIDKSKISNFKHLDTRLLNRFFDPENAYSVPYSWCVFGIGYNEESVGILNENISWGALFEGFIPAEASSFGALSDYRVGMHEDAGLTIFLASKYLFGTTRNITDERLHRIEDLLKKQKRFVECYGESSIPYFLQTKILDLAVVSPSFLKMITDKNAKIGFILPKEGSVISIENLVIPKTSKKADLVHKLIDFLISKKSSIQIFDQSGWTPANKEAYYWIDPVYLNNKSFFPDDEMFKKLSDSNNDVSQKKVEKLWIAVKMSK